MSSEARLVDTAFTTYQGPRADGWRRSGRSRTGARCGRSAPARLEGQGDPHLADAAGVRAGAGGAGPARDPRLGQRQPQRRQRRPVLRLHQHDRHRRPGVQRRDHAGAGLPDRRDRTLSLYFSTAIGRFDYVVGKIVPR
jgi:hypothetical protein